ncbi:MAG: M23 family metallopeptidase [Oligoflexales bacterium]
MRRTTIMIVPSGYHKVLQFSIPQFYFKLLSPLLLFLGFLIGGGFADYLRLREVQSSFNSLQVENRDLKGEAKMLVSRLKTVKLDLAKIQDYTEKLSEMMSLPVNQVSQKTGIGPLVQEDYHMTPSGVDVMRMPAALKVDELKFRNLFDELNDLGRESSLQAMSLQKLMSTLTTKRSLLNHIPTMAPVKGWVASRFGMRTSPFTGRQTMHKGMDIAANIGTPIRAPADGVVVFSGKKSGFGNFVVIAHEFGVVSRYGHNAQNTVRAGQRVRRGEQIATVGMTGRTTGPHLHYEVWVNSQPVNPNRFIFNSDHPLLAFRSDL